MRKIIYCATWFTSGNRYFLWNTYSDNMDVKVCECLTVVSNKTEKIHLDYNPIKFSGYGLFLLLYHFLFKKFNITFLRKKRDLSIQIFTYSILNI